MIKIHVYAGRKKKEPVTFKRSTDNFHSAECQVPGDLLALLDRARSRFDLEAALGTFCVRGSAHRAAGDCSAQDRNWDKKHYASGRGRRVQSQYLIAELERRSSFLPRFERIGSSRSKG